MKRRFLCTFLICLWAALCSGQIDITLNRSFVDKYADRVTMDADFRVDVTSKIHPASQDGDIHVAGTASEIGMIAVAEVMNAKSERTNAVKTLVDSAGTGQTVPVSGVWRIWSEHGGEQEFIQGDPVPPVDSSGAAHVFEIHPVTRVAGRDVSHTLAPIPGYTYKDADDAFNIYEGVRSTISEATGKVTISTAKAGYNYTEFVATLLTDPRATIGGTEVLAAIRNKSGDLLVKERRLVFAAGTPPEETVLQKHKGQSIQVVGIPRVSLKLVKWRLEHHSGKYSGSLTWNLPYELVIAAIIDDSPDVPQ